MYLIQKCLVTLTIAGCSLGLADQALASAWGKFDSPTQDTPEAVGGYTNGCLLGGQEIPTEGGGYQVIRLDRQRNYGHPLLVDYLSDLAAKVEAAQLGTMLVADVAMPRGGRFLTGHRSHQTGLDADIWLRLDIPPLPREQRQGEYDVKAVSMVDLERFRVNPDHWSDSQAELLRLAADDDRVARIFVHPAIKKALCDTEWEDRSWLRRIRPWHGHTVHLHVRLDCPVGSTGCVRQSPPPAGDGCGAELTAWLPPNYRKPRAGPPRTPPLLPNVCRRILEDAYPNDAN